MKKSLIIGAGEAGRQVQKLIINKGEKIVGFIDDFVKNRNVIGKIENIDYILENNKIDKVYFAIPSYKNNILLSKLSKITKKNNIDLKIIPSLIEIIDGDIKINKIREIKIEDLLGRPVNKININRIKNYIKGKTILVTGAGGTIGGELVKQLSYYGTSTIIGIDHSEIAIFNISKELQNNKDIKFYIRDIKNKNSFRKIFKNNKIDIIFNTAAYKHVYLMEKNPLEAISNNVLGLKNIIELSIENNINTFCQISTDKAVNPTNIMGSSKRLGELLIQYYSNKYKNINFNSVRFGNVLGSSGSVLTIFKEQIEKGNNLTVTDKNVTRYFMSIEEAVNLVITSITLEQKGKIYVLDMGNPVKIIDLAKLYIKLSGINNIGIDIIGLKQGEKLYEELILNNSKDIKTNIDKIYITEDKGNIDNFLEKITNLSNIDNKEKLIVEIKKIIPEFNHINR